MRRRIKVDKVKEYQLLYRDRVEEQEQQMDDPLNPSVSVLSKLGSLIVHIDEFMSTDGHAFDKISAQQLINDPEVRGWIKAMDKMALLPKKRSDR